MKRKQKWLRSVSEVLSALRFGSAFPGRLFSLKQGFILIFLPLPDPKNGHENETRYRVENMTKIFLFLRIAIGMEKGTTLTLLQIMCGADGNSFTASRQSRMEFLIHM